MKQKEPKQPDPQSWAIAGGHRNLTILGCILSALRRCWGWRRICVSGWWPGACCRLAQSGRGRDLGRWGWMAVWTAVGSILLYFAALMSTHIAAFRTARNIRRAAMAHVLKLPLGFFTGKSVGAAAQAHRRQRRAH